MYFSNNDVRSAESNPFVCAEDTSLERVERLETEPNAGKRTSDISVNDGLRNLGTIEPKDRIS